MCSGTINDYQYYITGIAGETFEILSKNGPGSRESGDVRSRNISKGCGDAPKAARHLSPASSGLLALRDARCRCSGGCCSSSPAECSQRLPYLERGPPGPETAVKRACRASRKQENTKIQPAAAVFAVRTMARQMQVPRCIIGAYARLWLPLVTIQFKNGPNR